MELEGNDGDANESAEEGIGLPFFCECEFSAQEKENGNEQSQSKPSGINAHLEIPALGDESNFIVIESGRGRA